MVRWRGRERGKPIVIASLRVALEGGSRWWEEARMLEGCDGLEKDLGSRVHMSMGARESIADEPQLRSTLSLIEHPFDLAQSPSAGMIL